MVDLAGRLKMAEKEIGISTHDVLLKFAFLQDMKNNLTIIGCPELLFEGNPAGFVMYPLKPMVSSKVTEIC